MNRSIKKTIVLRNLRVINSVLWQHIVRDGQLCVAPIAQKLEPDLHLAKLCKRRRISRVMTQPCHNFELPDEPGEINWKIQTLNKIYCPSKSIYYV